MTRVFNYIKPCFKTTVRQSLHSYHSHEWRQSDRQLTSQEVATALRPFIFVVHPDRFWRYPKEKETNEDSLKQLNAYIEDVIEMRETNDRKITFFMREDNKSSVNETNVRLKQIHINLFRKENVNKIVHKILIESKLSTDYLQKIGKKPKSADILDNKTENPKSYDKRGFDSKNLNDFWVNLNKKQNFDKNYSHFEEFNDFVVNKRNENNLKEWLTKNTDLAQNRLKTSEPIRQELNRLHNRLKQELGLNQIIWKDCGWGVSHIRGALKSLNTLKEQYERDFDVLRGRTLVLSRQTGVCFDGQIVLNIEDVRHNWMEMIRSISSHDKDLAKLPFIESTLSGVLRGIEIDNRKFRPTVLVKRYIKQLEKLTTALVEFIALKGFPKHWPPVLDKYQLVVECEAGPLMLSPTGQFIVPASCPAFLLFDFISDNMFKSRLLRDMYLNYKSKEVFVINQCLTAIGLQSIEKDDNVTPDLMIECCQNLIANKEIFIPFLRNSRLRVSHYYSVLLDGEICIPWSFRV